jgi:hypothetical protein
MDIVMVKNPLFRPEFGSFPPDRLQYASFAISFTSEVRTLSFACLAAHFLGHLALPWTAHTIQKHSISSLHIHHKSMLVNRADVLIALLPIFTQNVMLSRCSRFTSLLPRTHTASAVAWVCSSCKPRRCLTVTLLSLSRHDGKVYDRNEEFAESSSSDSNSDPCAHRWKCGAVWCVRFLKLYFIVH